MPVSPYIVLKIDTLNGNVCYAEGPGLSILGCQIGDLVGRRLNELFPDFSAKLGTDIKVYQGALPLAGKKSEDLAQRLLHIQLPGGAPGRGQTDGVRVPDKRE